MEHRTAPSINIPNVKSWRQSSALLFKRGPNSLALAVLLALFTPVAVDAATPVPAPELAVSTEEVVVDSESISSYRRLVADLETGSGAYAPELSEQLLSLGIALQTDGRHRDALAVFKRGTHLARINEGLYTDTQIPLVRGEISSLVALGKLSAADERQTYLHVVQQRSVSDPETRIAGLMQQAQWQKEAYQLGIGDLRYHRLMNMWDLYRGALTDIAAREGNTSPNLLPPLYGLLTTQYLIAGYQNESDGGSAGADYSARPEQGRFFAYRAQSFEQGKSVIRAIYDVELARTDQQFLATGESLVMLGDWLAWHGESEPALSVYRQAMKELVERDDAEQQIARIFSKPVPLPAIQGIHSLPPMAKADEGNLLLEFTVSAAGRVTDLTRQDENDIEHGQVNRLMRTLRKTRFRPRFENMEPVATQSIIHAYNIGE